MEPALQSSALELNTLAVSICPSPNNPECQQKCKNLIYRMFLAEIQKKANSKYKVSTQMLKKIKKFFKPSRLKLKIRNQRRIIFRGRPIKDRQAELKLAEWIKSSGRTRFTRKQLQNQYGSYLTTKKRPPTIQKLLRILQRCSIGNIQILVSRPHQIPGNQEIGRENLPSFSTGDSEQKKSSPYSQFNSFGVEFLSEDDQFFRVPENLQDKQFEGTQNKDSYE